MKYQELYGAVTKYTGVVIDLTTGLIAVNGYGVSADANLPDYTLPVPLAASDSEAFDTTVDRALTGCQQRNANHLLVRINDGMLVMTPMLRVLSKEFALGWAVANEQPFVWNVEKRQPINTTEKWVVGLWINAPGPLIAEGTKS